MVRPAHAPEHAIPAGHNAPNDNAWVAAHHDVHADGAATCGVTWWWIEPTGNRCFMATDFKDDLSAYHLAGFNLDALVADGAPDLIAIAMRDDTTKAWLDQVVPAVLANDDVDAMVKWRLAVRWAGARA